MPPTTRQRSLQLAQIQSAVAMMSLVVIGSTIGALIAAPEWCFPRKTTFATWKRQVIERHLDAELLILGSSHSHFGIAPCFLRDDAANLANAAQDVYYNCALARRYMPEMPKLKRVLLEVEIRGWENSIARSGDSWRMSAYYSEFGIPPEVWNLDSLLILASYRTKGPNFGKMDKPWFDDSGWGPREGQLNRFMGKVIAGWHTAGIREKESKMHLKEIGDTIRECAGRGVDVVLVRLPAHDCYRTALDIKAFARLREMTQELLRDHRIRYLDYYSDVRFADEDFYDPDHLNARGAEKFTKILDYDLAEAE